MYVGKIISPDSVTMQPAYKDVFSRYKLKEILFLIELDSKL